MNQADRAKITPHIEYLKKELSFLSLYEYEKEVDWKVYQSPLAHRYLDIRWQDIKRFFHIAFNLYPAFLDYIKKRERRISLDIEREGIPL